MTEWQWQPARDVGLAPSARWRSLRRETSLFESGLRLVWHGLLRLFLRCWFRLGVDGWEHLPARRPFVLVANHSSHLDALLLTAILPVAWRDHVSPLAAGDFFFEPAPRAAFSACVLNALPLWRRRQRGVGHALTELRERLLEQQSVLIVFPEGTRSRTGRMQTFQPGVGVLVAGTALPVVPCHLSGTFEAAPPHAHWPRFGRIRLRIGAPLSFAGLPNEGVGWRAVALALEEAVSGLGQVADGKSGSAVVDATSGVPSLRQMAHMDTAAEMRPPTAWF